MPEPANFFTDGAAYERVMGRWSALVGDIFLDWLALPKGLRWLDVGCGNGAFTERIVARCAPAAIQGIDPSADQIAYARTRPAARDVQFRQGDAQALPFANAAFDVAAMALVISFIPDRPKAVAEMARVTRPGGCVATYMWDTLGGGLPMEPIRTAMAALGHDTRFPSAIQETGLDDMRGFWAGAGLTAIESRVIEVERTFDDFDDFWQSNTALGSPVVNPIRALSAAEVEAVKARLRAQVPADGQGRITRRAWANAVKGRVPG
ncbi:MAG TPA: methyltransferase domain-containing protein [Stellaceae bacterium]|nr:methyltransferase domain-containing protein [Stellaceae bacterium]